ncbi:MAG: FAD-dependent oxidoreductase [Oscillospiraceae bacterium]|nr:FAD-dependent oxidoreductase [Oscillospiraceae bacterium]
MEYIIIGNSTAGIGCVEGIRQFDKNGGITVISDEQQHTYSRPLISYFVQGKVTAEKMKYRGDGFYRDNAVTLLSGVTAVKIDPYGKTVALSDGKILSYDKLLAATGSRAFEPSFTGIESVSCKNTFMTLLDAQKLASLIVSEKRVLIVGAGLIGLKCAEGVLRRVSEITVIDTAPRVLTSILDSDGAKLVQNRFEEKGVKFIFSKSIRHFDGNCAVLSDGTVIYFDIAVIAAGVRPNTELLSGIAQIGQGIVINEKSETSMPDIYAAGDCAESIDVSSGRQKVMALLPNAYMQGECAGVNMAGGNKSFSKAIPMNAIGFMGLHIITAGNYTGEVYESNKNGAYKKLFYSGNRLNGYIFIGDIEKAGIYTSLIREQTPLDSIDFALICEKPGLMAFTKEVRAEKLGAHV